MMINVELLRSFIERSGYKLSFIAKALGISRTALWQKVDGETEFKGSEITILANLLNLTRDERDAAFFAQNVDKTTTKH